MNRILFVIPSLRDGGAERVVSRLSAGFAEAGYEVHILEFFRPEAGYSLDDRVQLHSIFQQEAEYRALTFMQKNNAIRQQILAIAPDLIIPFLEHVCQKVQLATLFTNYFNKIVVSLRVSPSVGNAVHKACRLLSILLSPLCITQTESQKSYLPAFLQRKTKVIANPTNIPEEGFVDVAENCTFVAAGRLVRQKNYPLLLKAFARAAAERDVSLKIFGAGALKDDLQKLIGELGLSDRAELCGYSQDIVNDYRKCSIFVLSSDWEGMPNSLLEALALGMPCIATDCPTGPAELITDHENGLLVPMGDTDALAQAMLELADDIQLRRQLGENARNRVKRDYSLSHITNLWIDALTSKNLLQGKDHEKEERT